MDHSNTPGRDAIRGGRAGSEPDPLSVTAPDDPGAATAADPLGETVTGGGLPPGAAGTARIEDASGVAPAIPGYEILGELGRGGMGVVYEARQVRLNRTVAIKMILAGAHADPEASVRFLAEAEAVARLAHPNIVRIHHTGEVAGLPFLELEYVPGGNLARALDGTPWPPPRVAGLVQQLAGAVAEAHRLGIVHRDLKPSNVLLAADGTPKITDFGLAKSLSVDSGLTRTESILGSPSYMAPEQAGGHSKAVGPAADVYSLGAILYELLTGRPPFRAATVLETLEQVKRAEPVPPRRLVPGTPRDLETIALKCLQKDPAKRYASAEALAEDLRRSLAGEPIQARPVGPAERLWRWCRRNPVVAALAATSAALLALAATVATLAYAQTSVALGRETQARREAVAQRDEANRHLYRSLVGEARALRLARVDGYRRRCWDLLGRARRLDTPERDLAQLRGEALAGLGDFVGLEPAVLGDLPAEVRAIAPHPDADQIAIGLGDGTVLVRRRTTGAVLARWAEHPAPVSALAFGPDGLSLICGHGDGVLHIGTPDADGRWVCTQTVRGDGPPACLVALPGGRLLAGSVYRSAVRVAEVGRERVVDCSAGPGVGLSGAAALSPDGRLLAAAADRDGAPVVQLWDVAAREVKGVAETRLGTAMTLAFSPDGGLLACGCVEGVAVFDTAGSRRLLFVRSDEVHSIAFSPDSRMLAYTALQDGTVRLWSLVSNREIAALRPAEPPQGVAFGGRALVVAGPRSVRAWDLAGTVEKLTLAGHVGGVEGMTFSPDGSILATPSIDRTVKLWEAETGGLLRTLDGFKGVTRAVAFRPDGRLLVVGSADPDHPLRAWDPRSWDELPLAQQRLDHLDPSYGLQVWVVAFSPDGRLLAIGGDGCGLTLWHVGDPTEAGVSSLRRLGVLAEASVTAVQFSPDGTRLAWVQREGSLHLVDLAGRRPLRPPPARPAWHIRSLAFAPDGRHLAYLDGATRDLGFWEVASGRLAFGLPHARFEARRGTPSNGLLSASPDGRWLALSGRTVSVWDVERRDLLLALPEERAAIYSLAWSPDRRRLAVGSSDGGLVIWDLARIRSQLAEIGLDWVQQPETTPTADPPATQVGVDPGELTAERLEALRLEELKMVADQLLDRLADKPRTDPEVVAAYHHRGHILAGLGRHAEAVEDFTRALEPGPGDAHLLATRGQSRLQLGQHEPAAEDLERALEGAPDQPDLSNDLAWLYATGPGAMRAPEKARSLAERAVRLAPGVAAYRNTLGVALYRLGRYSEAAEALEASLRSGPDEHAAFSLFFLAMCHRKLGDPARAGEEYQRALRSQADAPLPPDQAEELRSFRAEAEAVLAEPDEP